MDVQAKNEAQIAAAEAKKISDVHLAEGAAKAAERAADADRYQGEAHAAVGLAKWKAEAEGKERMLTAEAVGREKMALP